MRMHKAQALSTALLLAACAGDGDGLDENGRPIVGGEDVLLPEFSSIQGKVFTPVCTTCHAGSRMPLNGPPLPPETIAVIRQWITDGAPQSASVPTLRSQTKAATLDAVWPLPDSVMRESERVVVLSASTTLDTAILDAGVVTLRRSGVSGGSPLALADLASRPIDGDGNGEPGGDFVLRFIVEETR